MCLRNKQPLRDCDAFFSHIPILRLFQVPSVSCTTPPPSMEPVKLSSFVYAKPRPKSPQTPTNKYLPPRAGQTSRVPVFPHRTASQTVIGNVDLFVLVAEQTTDTVTLLNLLEACETGRQAVKQMLISMISALLNLLPLEIRQMAVAILALESIKLSNSAERETFIKTYRGDSDERLPMLSDPVERYRCSSRNVSTAVRQFMCKDSRGHRKPQSSQPSSVSSLQVSTSL